MRVLTVGNMYPPHSLGGYERAWQGAVRHLAAGGHQVRVLTTDFRLAEQGPPEDEGNGDVYRELRWYWRDHAFPAIGVRERIRLERHNLDVLERHAREFAPEVIAWWAMGGMSMSLIERARRAGIPAAGFVLDDWLLYGPKVDAWHRLVRRLGPLRGSVERLTRIHGNVDLGAAARWLFISEAVRANALAALTLPDTGVVTAGIAGERFPPAAEREWSWQLLYAGRLDRRKGIHVALEALVEIPEARLTVDGDGDRDYLEELRRLARDRGIERRVTFRRSSTDALHAMYSEADAVVFPVLWSEPWGLVPLEAMAVGRPVIATGLGGSGEYLRDGVNSVLYEPAEDSRALAQALRRVAADPGLRKRLRAGGFETAAGHGEERFNSAVQRELEAQSSCSSSPRGRRPNL